MQKKFCLTKQTKNIVITYYALLKTIDVILKKHNIDFYENLETIINHPYLTQLGLTLQELDAQYDTQYDLASLITNLLTNKSSPSNLCHALITQKKPEKNYRLITSDNDNKIESSNKPLPSPQLCTQFALRKNVLLKLRDGEALSSENKNESSGENVTKSLFSGQKTH